MKSNCFIEAWKRYLNDDKVWLCFCQSRYSRLVNRVPAPVRFVSKMCLWPVFGLYLVLHTLAFERWPHFVWRKDMPSGAFEFVPVAKKRMHLLPPLFFDGDNQEYKA